MMDAGRLVFSEAASWEKASRHVRLWGDVLSWAEVSLGSSSLPVTPVGKAQENSSYAVRTCRAAREKLRDGTKRWNFDGNCSDVKKPVNAFPLVFIHFHIESPLTRVQATLPDNFQCAVSNEYKRSWPDDALSAGKSCNPGDKIKPRSSDDRALLSCWMCSQTKTRPPLWVCPPPRMRQPQLPPDRRFFCFFLLPAALALQSTQLVSDRGKLQHKAPSMSSTATRLKGQFPLNGMQQRQSRWHSSATPTISARFYTWSACSRRTMKEGRMKKDILRTVEIFSFYNNYPDGMHTYTTFLT